MKAQFNPPSGIGGGMLAFGGGGGGGGGGGRSSGSKAKDGRAMSDNAAIMAADTAFLSMVFSWSGKSAKTLLCRFPAKATRQDSQFNFVATSLAGNPVDRDNLFAETLNERHDAGEKDDHPFVFRILDRI